MKAIVTVFHSNTLHILLHRQHGLLNKGQYILIYENENECQEKITEILSIATESIKTELYNGNQPNNERLIHIHCLSSQKLFCYFFPQPQKPINSRVRADRLNRRTRASESGSPYGFKPISLVREQLIKIFSKPVIEGIEKSAQPKQPQGHSANLLKTRSSEWKMPSQSSESVKLDCSALPKPNIIETSAYPEDSSQGYSIIPSVLIEIAKSHGSTSEKVKKTLEIYYQIMLKEISHLNLFNHLLTSPGKREYKIIIELGCLSLAICQSPNTLNKMTKNIRGFAQNSSRALFPNQTETSSPTTLGKRPENEENLATTPEANKLKSSPSLSGDRVAPVSLEDWLAEPSPELLEITHTLTQANCCRSFPTQRATSQKDLFDGLSAKEAAQLLGLPIKSESYEEIKYEWNHLLAYRFLGADAQVKENLFLGTYACNSMMMHLEEALSHFVKHNSNVSISLEIKAEIEQKTENHKNFHCPKGDIHYMVKINKEEKIYEFLFTFDPKNTIYPPQNLKKAIEAYFKSTIRADIELQNETTARHTVSP